MRVVNVGFFPLSEAFLENREQMPPRRAVSDAWHLELGETDVMTAYLLELTAGPERPRNTLLLVSRLLGSPGAGASRRGLRGGRAGLDRHHLIWVMPAKGPK